ncbi:MAG: IS1380 family transposase [Rickettsia endosymbiont of Cimex lectularius]|nr:MAG: IS1380 family transposase [Rickettsia endosymbiont of Cimex lectularius]
MTLLALLEVHRVYQLFIYEQYITNDLAKLFPDKRNPSKITHSLVSILKQRIYSIALGYENLNDHDHLRKCPALQTTVGTLEDMASSPTLYRFENKAVRQFAIEVHKLMLDKFIASYKTVPSSLILDFDATDDEIHGNQEGKFYHGYYRHNCFFPLYVFCGKKLLVNYLRQSDQDQAKHAWVILSLLVKYLRKAWSEVEIIFRGDGGFCRHKMLDWCDSNNVKYIVGMAKNNNLNKLLASIMQQASKQFATTKEKQRLFSEFQYQAGSWSRQRKIIGKAEVGSLGENPRYVVTNLAGKPEDLYDKIYCTRGDMENRIKEQQLQLFADRTSCHKWWANQLRLLLSGLAYTLIEYIRDKLLQGTELAKAQVGTIRLKLFKIGAIIIRNTRSIKFLLASSYPYQHIWNSVLKALALE